ncbi:hypothetical protein PZ897_03515 [Hoeflea sp. YIM 152468]|uniref:hypothetical protein n=1 Tax=Hoeflea sp. YIM 152468 TaxID=3031759 RepID=UPI0023DCA9A0|nr:hypothetical protein [Hoeflea sp. YIM 152468]MDF1607239.1 hypothetical protein [Hoeflea sp. YIM 152468]
MPHSASAPFNSPDALAMPAPGSRFTAFLTAIGAIVLIASEIWLVAIGTIWAIDGFFSLGTIGGLILIAIVVPLALWATWTIAMLAIAAELDPANAD